METLNVRVDTNLDRIKIQRQNDWKNKMRGKKVKTRRSKVDELK